MIVRRVVSTVLILALVVPVSIGLAQDIRCQATNLMLGQLAGYTYVNSGNYSYTGQASVSYDCPPGNYPACTICFRTRVYYWTGIYYSQYLNPVIQNGEFNGCGTSASYSLTNDTTNVVTPEDYKVEISIAPFDTTYNGDHYVGCDGASWSLLTYDEFSVP